MVNKRPGSYLDEPIFRSETQNWRFFRFPGENLVARIMAFRDTLPLPMQDCVTDVNIRSDEKHFVTGRFSNGIAPAHCHFGDAGLSQICIQPGTLDRFPSMLWHEYGHAWHHHLNTIGSNFSDRWVRHSVDSKSLLTAYGARAAMFKNYREDIAEWVEHVYLNLNGYLSQFSAFQLKALTGYFNLSACRVKLKLLRLYGFVNEGDYLEFLRRNPIFKAPELQRPRRSP